MDFFHQQYEWSIHCSSPFTASLLQILRPTQTECPAVHTTWDPSKMHQTCTPLGLYLFKKNKYYIYVHNILHILSYMILYDEYITYYIYTVWILFLWFRIQTIHVIFDHKSLLGSFSITHQSSKEKNFSSNGVLSPEWFSPLLNFQYSTWGKTQV